MNATEFFATARERYLILQKKRADDPKPWTDDPIFQTWRFCNVHREDDKTTVWFRENIRQHIYYLGVLEATLIFRWFNRIEVGEIIKDMLLENCWDRKEAYLRLKDVKPIITGAYMVATPQYMTKLEGVLYAIDQAQPHLDRVRDYMMTQPVTLEKAWEAVTDLPWIGPFTGYEIITDLRHTAILQNASDIMTWANPGPGCARGIEWLTGSQKLRRGNKEDRAYMLGVMRDLLNQSLDNHNWPHGWRQWEMREVEHWLCEFDKYKRAQSGQSLKRRYS